MNKLAIMADIHSNLKALKTALNLIDEEQIDLITVCGDIVGYGKHPNECCEIIRELACPVIAGNHDLAVADLIEYKSSHSKPAVIGIEYTKKVITQKNLEWLKSLALQYSTDGMQFVHGSLIKPEEFHYLILGNASKDSIFQDVCENFTVMEQQVCFVGHSHVPTIFLEKSPKNVKVIEPNKLFYKLNDNKAIINVGSIGKPRVASRKASFVIYEPDTCRVIFKRFAL